MNLKDFYKIKDLPLATASNAGVIKPGNCLSVTADGILNVDVPEVFNDVINGYLDSNSFYKDVEKTILIPGETGKIYINNIDKKQYIYDESTSTFFGPNNSLMVANENSGLIGDGSKEHPLALDWNNLIYSYQGGDGNPNPISISLLDGPVGEYTNISLGSYEVSINARGNGGGSTENEGHIHLQGNNLTISLLNNDVQNENSIINTFVFTNDDIRINNHGLNQSLGLAKLDEFGKLPNYVNDLSNYKGNYWLYDNTVNDEYISIKAVHDNMDRSKVIIDNIDSQSNSQVTINLTSAQKRVLSNCNGFTVQFTIFGEGADIKQLPNCFSLFTVGPFAEWEGNYGDFGVFMFHKDEDDIRDFKIETNDGSREGLRKLFEDDQEKIITITASENQIRMYIGDTQESLNVNNGADFYADVNLEWVKYNPNHVKDIKIWNRVLTEEEILSTLESNSTSIEESGNTLLELAVEQAEIGTKATISLNSFDIFSTQREWDIENQEWVNDSQNLLFSVTPNDIIYNGNSFNRAGGLVILDNDMMVNGSTIAKYDGESSGIITLNPHNITIKNDDGFDTSKSQLTLQDGSNAHVKFDVASGNQVIGGTNGHSLFQINSNNTKLHIDQYNNIQDTGLNTEYVFGDKQFDINIQMQDDNVDYDGSNSLIFNQNGLTLLLPHYISGTYETINYQLGTDGFNLFGNTISCTNDLTTELLSDIVFNTRNNTLNTRNLIININNPINDDIVTYSFTTNGLIYQGHNPNTAKGIVVLDSNSYISNSLINLSNYSINNIALDGLSGISFTTGGNLSLYSNGDEISITSDVGTIKLVARNLSFNSNSLNTAGGLVKLDNNGKIPSNIITPPNNGVLTIKRNNVSIGTFSADSSTSTSINIVVPTTASDVNALPNTTKYGKSLDLNLSNSNYIMTLKLKDQDGNVLSSNSIDLPLETMVVSGHYNSNSKSVVLELKNGNNISFSIADLISGLQNTLTAGNGININNNVISNTGHISIESSYDNPQNISLSVNDNDVVDEANLIVESNHVKINGNSQHSGFTYNLGSEFSIGFTDNAYQMNSNSNSSEYSLKNGSAKFTFKGITSDGIGGNIPYSNSFEFISNGDIRINNHGINQAQGLVQLDSNSRIPDNSYQHVEQVTKTLSNYTSNGTVSINDLTSGLVVAVINNEGKQVYPDIQYTNGIATITGNFGEASIDTTWTIFKLNYLTFNG